ncbi:MAG: transcriptional repressor [Thermoleophilia bacterium]|jgi:Fur family ferric uptake transcriptional regulator|nr:transcriptional repressor [Thermoleophilia bacterium]
MSPRHPAAPASRSHIRAARDAGPEAAELLRRAGCRPSPQRLLVLQALARGGHVTAERALEHARASYPAINPSTVYRTLDALVEAGIARRTDLGGPSRHYELAHEHPHHHAVCAACGAVAHFHSDTLRGFAEALAEATGHVLVQGREITVPAVCAPCRRAITARRAAVRPRLPEDP